MSVTDLTYSELQAMVYEELKAPSTSEAYPIAWVQELLNEAYFDVFNQPKRNVYTREKTVALKTIPYASLTGAGITGGATTVNVADTSYFPTAGSFLAGSDVIAYTGKTATSFTGCTGSTTDVTTDIPIRYLYPLSSIASTMDEQQIRALTMDSIPYTFKAWADFNSNLENTTLNYTILDGFLLLPVSNQVQKLSFVFFQKVIPMAITTDKPTFVPNSFRKMLVFYATGRLLAADDKRTGYELYYNYNPEHPERSSGLYFTWLRNFYAKFSRRIDTQRKRVGSVWD